ncbi:uncharacterized protein LOC110827075 isoform X2 [Zootermopsis nevadensis]|uniref:uncharacterized protein LOC110827075 isoform X2 n=1 Tax=Zootermopsis nevadensis TaxID=136037 RepID=UPI000B8E7410|nr:uncharacterized protein LOC110827075 isoform X2 [Zootermopsis nevadensis]
MFLKLFMLVCLGRSSLVCASISAAIFHDLGNGKLNSAVSDWTEDKIKAAEKQETEKEPLQCIIQQHHNNLYCKYCDKTYHSFVEFHHHLLYHVQLPNIIVQRLNPSYVRRIVSHKTSRSGHKGRRRNFARKHTRSYIVPRVKNKVPGPLKLTLKLASDATTDKPSFEVVPQKILSGPGGLYFANGVLDEVKTEVFTGSEDVEWNSKSVDGKGEGAGWTSESVLESSEENSGISKGGSVEQDKSEEEVGGWKDKEVTRDKLEEGAQNREEATEDPCLNTIADSNLDDNQQQEVVSTCPSPSPSEQLRPEFLAPEEESCDSLPSSPAMVEVSGTTIAEAGSPAFPTSSPAPPATSGDSNSHHLAPEEDRQSPSVDNPEEELQSESGGRDEHNNEQSNEISLPSETGNFTWNDIANVPAAAADDPVSNTGTLEERDPLMIPDQTSADPGHENDNSGPLSGRNSSDSLLRGFLCDPSTGDKAIAVTTSGSAVVGNVLDGLGSEYISLERLGETSTLACCDVCGEQTSNLDEHRARSGHYKCGHQECGNLVFSNLGELASHQHVSHGSSGQSSSQPPSTQPYSMPHHQPPPVQQLAQQVQRLPIPPPQQLSPHQMNHHSSQPVVQQMSPQLHQLMPPQQPYPQPPVRRPPPLYRVPGSGNVPGTPPGMQHQYPNHSQQPQQQQHMMPPQMYSQQPYPQSQNNYPAPAGSLPTPRPYSNMGQQLNRPRAPSQHSMQRPNIVQQQQQQQPRMGLQQKRPAVVTNSPGSSPNKQRRMDVLLPDRHDDADCHVIAMQKRTDSGPVIGNVQGATNNSGRPESMIHLTDSITLSVRQPQGGAGVGQPVVSGGKSKSDAKAVANILATRGITVTPAGGTGGRSVTQQSPQQQQRQARPSPATQSASPAASQPITTLNLNSAISIIAQPTASSSRQQQGNFAVPHGRGNVSRSQKLVERPPRPPTVDLTGDGPPPPPLLHSVSRGRGRGRGVMGRYACQVCDKVFSTQESLNQHMTLHRSPGKLPYRCSLCSAQYPTQQGLLQHRQAYHKEPAVQPGAELAVPIVDLKAPGALNRLAGLGIHHYVPLSQLVSQSGGYFGLPIVSVDGARNPAVCNLGSLGASSVLSLGPLKHLGR